MMQILLYIYNMKEASQYEAMLAETFKPEL